MREAGTGAVPGAPGFEPPGFEAVEKRSFGKGRKLLLGLAALVDPGAWAHAFRRWSFHYRTSVLPLRRMAVGTGARVSPFATFLNPERIALGRNVRIGDRCCLWAGHGSARIVIGDDVMLGPEVMINCAVYRFDDGAPVWRQRMDEADIVIGDDVWIATRVQIMPGVTVGAGAVLGAGSIVTKDVPPGAVVVGAPARVVRQRRAPG